MIGRALASDVLQHQRVRLPFALLDAPFSGIFRAPATVVPNSLACKAIKKAASSLHQRTSQRTNNPSVKPLWAAQPPANRSTSPRSADVMGRWVCNAACKWHFPSISKSGKVCRQHSDSKISEPICLGRQRRAVNR